MIKPTKLGNDAISLLQSHTRESSEQVQSEQVHSEQLEITEQLALIQQLEHRHDDLLEKIAELEIRVSSVLETWTKNRVRPAARQQSQ